MADLDVRIDTQGTLDALRRELADWPEGIARARKTALRKLSRWVQRQLLKEISSAVQVPQKTLKALVRYRVTTTAVALTAWVGTDPIGAHNLGTVKWTPRMQGARVGRRSFPHSWSWKTAKRTAGLVMERETDRRQPIAKVTVAIHETARAKLTSMEPEIMDRFMELLRQALNTEIWREAQRRGTA